jgi:hypothetical protein
MNFNTLLGILAIVIGSHIMVHEVVIAIRCLVNKLNGRGGSWTDIISILAGIGMLFDRVSFDRGLRSAADNNDPTAYYEILIRIFGGIVMVGGALLLFGWVSLFANAG